MNNSEKNIIPFSNEINILLKELYYEDWMGEDDWQMLLKEVETTSGITKEKLSKDIEVGIKNGHSIEKQFELIRHFFKK